MVSLTPRYSWKEVLTAEGIPLNSSVEFQCHNENVRRVVLGGKQVPMSEVSREFAREWIRDNRQEAFIVDTSRLDGYDWKKAVKITIDFHNGEPHGHPAFGNRKQKALALESHWRQKQ